jgi:hypothetical protein
MRNLWLEKNKKTTPLKKERRRMQKNSSHLLKVISAILIILVNCINNITEAAEPVLISANWDTTFTVANFSFPDSNANKRSLIAFGNQERLKSFYSNLLINDTLRIGVIGGSITEGASATKSENAYGARLCKFLKNNYPDKHFSLINAGIGATTSRFACSRVVDDLLSKRPNLIIIEFAANDRPSDSAAFEGLVRICLKNSDAPIILFFTTKQSGNNYNQIIESRIGAHYDLSMISYRDAVWPLLTTNLIPWDSIAADDVHPNDSGHLICAQLLFSFLKKSLSNFNNSHYLIPEISNPLITDFYENSGIYDTTAISIAKFNSNGWYRVVKENGRVGYISIGASDTISFESSHRELTIGFRYSKDYNANLEIIVDGKYIATINNYFKKDWGGGYMALFTVYRDEVPTKHTIKLIKTNGDQFTVEYLLFVD